MVNITLFSQGKMISPFFFPPDEGVLWVRQYINMPLFLLLGVSLHLVCLCIPNCSFFILAKESEVAQSCPTLCKPMDCSLPGSSIHGIFQAIVLEWVAIPFSRGSSWPRDWTLVSCIIDRRFNIWATPKCTQVDARPLPDSVYKDYLNLFIKEMEIVKPKVDRKSTRLNSSHVF